MKNGTNNMSNNLYYVPILKWKTAERNALMALTEEQKKNIKPLIQLVMPNEKKGEQLEDVVSKFEKQITQIPTNILEVWGKNQVFIDVSLLYNVDLKVRSLVEIIKEGHKIGIVTVPVIHLNDEQEIKDTAITLATENGGSICLRLICADLDDIPKMNQKIKEFISRSKLVEQNFDLLVDIKDTENNEEKHSKYLSLSQSIINLLEWKSFIFASGAFPKDLSDCKIDDENLIPRLDWKNWLIQISSAGLQRKPAFADYTIQHPIYSKSAQFFHPTTSIKYTLDNKWLVMKGKKIKFEMYLANAAVLVKDPRFRGELFSSGDKFIVEKANHYQKYMEEKNKGHDIKGTGSTVAWLTAGINHHLVLTAHQVANLS